VRLLTTAGTLGAILVLGTACASSAKSAASPDASSPASAGTSTSPTADAAANTKQVCTDVKQFNTDYTEKITTIFKQVTQDVMKGDEAAGQKHVDEMNAQSKEWIAKVQGQSAKASSPELRNAVNDLATKLKKLESGDASIQDMNNIVQEANTTLAKSCG
jgi:lysyl-tRNA synthetase class I